MTTVSDIDFIQITKMITSNAPIWFCTTQMLYIYNRLVQL